MFEMITFIAGIISSLKKFPLFFSIEIYRLLFKKTGMDRKVLIIYKIYNQFVTGKNP
jgi:hypothetical protein